MVELPRQRVEDATHHLQLLPSAPSSVRSRLVMQGEIELGVASRIERLDT